MKIRHKITFQFAGIVSVILIGFSIAVYFYFSTYRTNEFYSVLDQRALTVAHMYLEADELSEAVMKEIRANYSQVLDNEIVWFFDSENHSVIYAEQSRIDIPLEKLDLIRQESRLNFQKGNRQFSGLYYRDNQGDFVIVASAIDKSGLNMLYFFKLILLTGIVLSLGFLIVFGNIFAEQTLTPVKNLVRQISRITPESLHLRIKDSSGKDEISELSRSFNNMLDHLEEAFSIQSSFVTNATHELSIPLDELSRQITNLQSELAANKEISERIRPVSEEVKRLSKLSKGLIALSDKVGSHVDIGMEPLKLDELLQNIKADEQSKDFNVYTLKTDEKIDFNINGNSELLRIAFRNSLRLLSNLSQSDAELKVNLSQIDNGFQIKIQNKARVSSLSSSTLDKGEKALLPIQRILELHKGLIISSGKELREEAILRFWIPLI